jgi:hypothetical protein
MATARALHHALDLLNKPILAGLIREQPLPEDVLMLIQIAAGDIGAQQRAAAMTQESPERIREAAVLYLQHILLAPGADHYRVLGVEFDAPRERLRLHLGWLMKWLHPDRTRSQWDSAFAERVIAAWDALKTPERRQRYDGTLEQPARRAPQLPHARRPEISLPARRIPWIARQPDQPIRRRPGRRRILAFLLVGAVAAAVWLLPSAWRMPWHGQEAGSPRTR